MYPENATEGFSPPRRNFEADQPIGLGRDDGYPLPVHVGPPAGEVESVEYSSERIGLSTRMSAETRLYSADISTAPSGKEEGSKRSMGTPERYMASMLDPEGTSFTQMGKYSPAEVAATTPKLRSNLAKLAMDRSSTVGQ